MLDPQAKPMYMCFKNIHCADRCRRHFARIKSEHGVWPIINLSEDRIDIVPPPNVDKFPVSHSYNQLEIDTIEEDDIVTLGNITGSSIMYCHEFNVISGGLNSLNISFSGQEIQIPTDYKEYIRTLEEGIAG